MLLPVAALAAPAVHAAAAAHAAGGASLPGYVAVRLWRSGNFIALETTTNGHATPLLVDTGSPLTAISEAAYHASVPAGAAPAPGVNVPRQLKINGKLAGTGWIGDLRAGAMNFGGGPVVVMSLSDVRYNRLEGAREHSRVEGILGMDVMTRYGAILDPARQLIYFNTDPSRRVHLGQLITHSGWTAIPMTLTPGHHLSVPTVIGGKQFQVIVDTGAFLSALDAERLGRLNLVSRDVPLRSRMINQSSAPVKLLVLKNWKIGDYTLASFALGMEELPEQLLRDQASGGPTAGLLGADVLLKNHAIIDLGGMKLYLKP